MKANQAPADLARSCIAGAPKETRGIVADNVDPATRSRMMAGIRGKDTKPEITLRRALHARGLRYRLHAGDISGRPDLAFPKYRAVIFVHGCFWHRHKRCRYATTPATRVDFWKRKFAANLKRDSIVRARLAATGWRVAIVWECALRRPDLVPAATDSVVNWLNSDESFLEAGAVGA